MNIGWIYLFIAGIAEIFYAATIVKTDGFTRIIPSIFCCIFICISIYLLSLATRSIPIGTAYAVWVGIGAIGTAVYGVIVLDEACNLVRILCFLCILVGIIGLKISSSIN
ncbi:DMT family transporter [Acinetobacter baumannii]|uniref:Guanidinium exporter n=1 Tax=Acinetobacter baumannii TaxID=470 RepID=A0A505MUV9_ACIBA|nr:multidrug efflux SMR transporter [Acinetobacter baumannii]EJB8497458.1 multidrug efflux SMR transporter [Acinetobacter baumannii]ELB0341917.1 multidrug efflux SMR transporter [Acinetobacter baumannii]KCY24733.1 small Multidrug Resistance family protein [Acinetobacter baumannii 233846]MCJ8816219.1 multidrug efflux SMR transporter [Acinetobacter baumannii]MCJ8987333.1 multidrug efflux SMR transporter [Acinetobacter baumannii]